MMPVGILPRESQEVRALSAIRLLEVKISRLMGTPPGSWLKISFEPDRTLADF